MINKHGTLSKPKGDPKNIQFWCFDLAIPNVKQKDRTNYRYKHLPSTPCIINVHEDLVGSDEEAREKADAYIEEGFEGGILRELDKPYGFGKRVSYMMKLKKWFYTKCRIIDIVNKGENVINGKTRTYIAVILKNDINEDTFECNIEGNESYRIDLLKNVDSYIGKMAEVKYRERSGIKLVPFQSVIFNIDK